MLSINLLADLLNRFYSEQSDLLTYLRGTRSENGKTLQRRLAMIQFEQQCVEKEEWFDLASYSVGMLERIEAALGKR